MFSTSSLSLLPARPNIFHGRDKEVKEVLQCVGQEQPSRIAILGPGGMGKSSLALAVLHYDSVASKFGSHRYFIPCDSASSSAELLSVVSHHLGLTENSKPSKAIIRHLSSISQPILLVLDNLETAWEPTEYRSQVEEFLSLLGDIMHLHLVVNLFLFTLLKSSHMIICLGDHERCRTAKSNAVDTTLSPTSHTIE